MTGRSDQPSPEGGRPHQPHTPDTGQNYPYGGPGYPPDGQGPAPPHKPSSGLSITAFVLGLIGCLVPLAAAAVIVGIVALVKKQALRGLAIAGIVLGLLWTVAGIAFWASGMPARIADSLTEAVDDEPAVDHWAVPGGLSVGECLNDPAASVDGEGELADQIVVVPCDQPHDLEAYKILTLPEGDFPGDSAIEELALTICMDAFEDFIGVPYEESEFEIYYYYPFEDTWNYADDRNISCTAGSLTGRTTGSADGANR